MKVWVTLLLKEYKAITAIVIMLLSLTGYTIHDGMLMKDEIHAAHSKIIELEKPVSPVKINRPCHCDISAHLRDGH